MRAKADGPAPSLISAHCHEVIEGERGALLLRQVAEGQPGWGEPGLQTFRSQTAHRPRLPAFPPPPPSVQSPPLTPASAASDQLWLLLRISSTDQGLSHTGSDAGARSSFGIVRFICSGKDKERG